MTRLFALALLVACGSPDEPTSPPIAAPQPAPAAREPAPGIDLTGPIPLPDRSGPARKGAAAPAPIDLASDRAVEKLELPTPPRGGAVGFQFADERSGWIARIPDGVQLPSVAYGDGRVYISGGFESVSFYALEAETGNIAWATTALEDNGPTAAIFEDGRVVFNTESCTLFALDAKSGKRLWFKWLGDPTLAQTAVAGGLVFAAHPAQGGHQLSAYKVATGDNVWSRAIGNELLVTPVVHGDSVYASTIDGATYRIRRASGKVVWQRRLRATTAPWIANGELYTTRRHGKTEQQIVVDLATGKLLREHQTARGQYTSDVPVNLANWKTVWAFEGSRPVVDRGVRYVAMGGEIHATDAQSGEALWHRRYTKAAGTRSLGTVALAGSTIVVSSRDGTVFGLDVDTGYTLWSYDLGHRVIAQPVIARGWLYATTADGYVIGLHVGDSTLDGWHMFGGNPHHSGLVETPPRA